MQPEHRGAVQHSGGREPAAGVQRLPGARHPARAGPPAGRAARGPHAAAGAERLPAPPGEVCGAVWRGGRALVCIVSGVLLVYMYSGCSYKFNTSSF